MKTQFFFNSEIVLINKDQCILKRRIINVFFFFLFILMCNPVLKSQTDYHAVDYHKFIIDNYSYAFVKIGMTSFSSNAIFETDKDGFYFNKPIYVSELIGSDLGGLNIRSNSTWGGNINLIAGEKINIQADAYMPFDKSFVVGNSFSEDNPRLRIVHTGIHAYIDYQDNLYFRANKNWISALILFGDGKVGVGFSTNYDLGHYLNVDPQYKLVVNGGIICEEVRVIADVPDADYVFEKDYKLLSIRELESFIQTNKHLPDIPSAEEFRTNGYKVGEMDEMLLRKIEELTLYIIELEKQINELKEVHLKGGE